MKLDNVTLKLTVQSPYCGEKDLTVTVDMNRKYWQFDILYINDISTEAFSDAYLDGVFTNCKKQLEVK